MMFHYGMKGFGAFDVTTLDPGLILIGFNQKNTYGVQPGVFPIQAALVEVGAMSPTLPSGKSSIDGLWGPVTEGAFAKVTGTNIVDRDSLAKLAAAVIKKQTGKDPVTPPTPPNQPAPAIGSACPAGYVGFYPACIPTSSIPPIPGLPQVTPHAPPLKKEEDKKDNTLLYVGIGFAALLVLGGGVALIVSKKKKKPVVAVSNRRRRHRRSR